MKCGAKYFGIGPLASFHAEVVCW